MLEYACVCSTLWTKRFYEKTEGAPHESNTNFKSTSFLVLGLYPRRLWVLSSPDASSEYEPEWRPHWFSTSFWLIGPVYMCLWVERKHFRHASLFWATGPKIIRLLLAEFCTAWTKKLQTWLQVTKNALIKSSLRLTTEWKPILTEIVVKILSWTEVTCLFYNWRPWAGVVTKDKNCFHVTVMCSILPERF